MITYRDLQLRKKSKRMCFLDGKILRNTTSAYHKPRFGVYTHFERFLPSAQKFGTIYTLAQRCFRICSSWTKLQTEILFLKEIFLKKWLP